MGEILLNALKGVLIYGALVLIHTILAARNNINIWQIKWNWKTWVNGVVKYLVWGGAVLGLALCVYFLSTNLTSWGVSIDNINAVSNKVLMAIIAMGCVGMASKCFKDISKSVGVDDDMLNTIQEKAVSTKGDDPLELSYPELPAPAVEVSEEEAKDDNPVLDIEVQAGMGAGGEALTQLRSYVGQFILASSGQYQGQCPEVPKLFRTLCGLPNKSYGNGKDVVDNMIKDGIAVECGREPGAIFSNTDGEYGHTGVVLDNTYLIEQNVNYGGLPGKNFGVGMTYPVRIGRFDEAWRKNKPIKYCRLLAYKPATPATPPATEQPTAKKSVSELATEVINGLWGNDPERTARLKAAGYDRDAVQAEVDARLKKGSQPVAVPKTDHRTYTVARGDSLWLIAVKCYNDGKRWTKIYQANRAVIGNNPNIIRAGQVLTIPA